MGLIRNLYCDGISNVAPGISHAAFHAARNACIEWFLQDQHSTSTSVTIFSCASVFLRLFWTIFLPWNHQKFHCPLLQKT